MYIYLSNINHPQNTIDMKQLFTFFLLLAVIFSCKKEVKPIVGEQQENTEASNSNDWIYLFDGVSTKGWRAYNGQELPPGWIAKDSTLTFDTELGLEQDYKGGIDIVYGDEEFENFELYLEWKLPEGGNSGIYYHLKENIPDSFPNSKCKFCLNMSPEYQLIDDANYASIHDVTEYNISVGFENPSQLHPLQKTASDYAMYAADESIKILHPPGEWNSSKILFTPEKVEYWLNGVKVLSFVPWSEDWYARKNAGKWKDEELYGTFKSGYIGLQDHASPIWFKNIKIRKL